jgi:hypothetical protein
VVLETYPRSPKICVQYGCRLVLAYLSSSLRSGLTPAKTLDRSNTLIPSRGSLGAALELLCLGKRCWRTSCVAKRRRSGCIMIIVVLIMTLFSFVPLPSTFGCLNSQALELAYVGLARQVACRLGTIPRFPTSMPAFETLQVLLGRDPRDSVLIVHVGQPNGSLLELPEIWEWNRPLGKQKRRQGEAERGRKRKVEPCCNCLVHCFNSLDPITFSQIAAMNMSAWSWTRTVLRQAESRGFGTSSMLQRIQKISPSAADAVSKIKSDSTVLVGGFGFSGVPSTLINAVAARPELKGLTVVSNNAGMPGVGLGMPFVSDLLGVPTGAETL